MGIVRGQTPGVTRRVVTPANSTVVHRPVGNVTGVSTTQSTRLVVVSTYIIYLYEIDQYNIKIIFSYKKNNGKELIIRKLC